MLTTSVSDLSVKTWFCKLWEYFGVGGRLAYLALLVAIPWAWGSAPHWAAERVLPWLLGVTFLGVLGGMLAGLRRTVGWLVPLLGAAVLAYGWTMALHPLPYRDPIFEVYDSAGKELHYLDDAMAWGTRDPSSSMSVMLRLTGLALAFLISANLASRRSWGRALMITLAANGALLSLYGLIQKADRDYLGIWEGRVLPTSVFGPFWYHANAAAFLELCWPLAAVLMFQALRIRWYGNQASRIIWVLATLAMAAGFFVNISRAGHILFLGQAMLLPVGLFWIGRQAGSHDEQPVSAKAGGMLFVLLAGGVVAIAASFGWENAWQRWPGGEQQESNVLRLEVYRYCWNMLPKAGWLGIGPGAFDAVFATAPLENIPKPRGHWVYAHNDYLQYALEWGVVGGAMLMLLVSAAVWKLISRMSHLRRQHSTLRATTLWAIMVALGAVAAHGLVDFPLQILSIQLYVVTLLGAGVARSLEN